MKDKRVYVTRDSHNSHAEVYPATVGIRKFRGCTIFGAAWSEERPTGCLSRNTGGYCEMLLRPVCEKRFGFYPKAGTAWYINQRGQRTKVNIEFTR